MQQRHRLSEGCALHFSPATFQIHHVPLVLWTALINRRIVCVFVDERLVENGKMTL